MPQNEKEDLQKELSYIKILIEFHNKSRATIWKDKEPELEKYIDDILDRYNEIQKQLDKLNNDDKK